MAELNKTNNFFKGISISQVLNIVAITLSVVAIILSIIAISMKPSQNCGNMRDFMPNQMRDFNKGNNPIDDNNQWRPNFEQRFSENDKNWQNNGFDKNPNVQRKNRSQSPKTTIDNNGLSNNTNNNYNSY